MDKGSKPGKGDGRMYTGGTPNFNERTGEYRGGKEPGKGRVKPLPVRPGGPGKGINPPRKKRPVGIGRPAPKPFPGNGGADRATPKPIIRKKGPASATKPGVKGEKTVKGFDPRKERQLPTRVKPQGQRRKASDMGKTARNGRVKPVTRGR